MYFAATRADTSAVNRFYDVLSTVGADLDEPDLRNVLIRATAIMVITYIQAQDLESLGRMTAKLEHAPYRDEVRALVEQQIRGRIGSKSSPDISISSQPAGQLN